MKFKGYIKDTNLDPICLFIVKLFNLSSYFQWSIFARGLWPEMRPKLGTTLKGPFVLLRLSIELGPLCLKLVMLLQGSDCSPSTRALPAVADKVEDGCVIRISLFFLVPPTRLLLSVSVGDAATSSPLYYNQVAFIGYKRLLLGKPFGLLGPVSSLLVLALLQLCISSLFYI